MFVITSGVFDPIIVSVRSWIKGDAQHLNSPIGNTILADPYEPAVEIWLDANITLSDLNL
jgi:hypothetical protein